MARAKPDIDEAPPIPDRLPWGGREVLDLASDVPPSPLTLTEDLTEEHVEVLQAAAAGRKFSLPAIGALVVYFALKTYFGDDLPDILLYILLGATFLLNTLMSMRRNKNHYAQPGRISLTFSADGVEVSAERWAGHVPWVAIDAVDRDDSLLIVRTATAPAFHGIPIHRQPPHVLAELDAWMAYGRRHRPRRPGRALLKLALVILAALGALWVWDQLGRPVP